MKSYIIKDALTSSLYKVGPTHPAYTSNRYTKVTQLQKRTGQTGHSARGHRYSVWLGLDGIEYSVFNDKSAALTGAAK